jgi:hypothetical protein
MKLHRDGEVRVLKLHYTLQQGATIQYYEVLHRTSDLMGLCENDDITHASTKGREILE